MDKSVDAQQEGSYNIFQNNKGEILIIIHFRAGGPENPRIVYDGGDSALLYRSRESSVVLDKIDFGARSPLKSVSEVLMVELDGDEVAREYAVPVRIVKEVAPL